MVKMSVSNIQLDGDDNNNNNIYTHWKFVDAAAVSTAAFSPSFFSFKQSRMKEEKKKKFQSR